MKLDITPELRANDPQFAGMCDVVNNYIDLVEVLRGSMQFQGEAMTAQRDAISAQQKAVEMLQTKIVTLKECMRLDAMTIDAKDRHISELEALVATLRAQASARSAA